MHQTAYYIPTLGLCLQAARRGKGREEGARGDGRIERWRGVVGESDMLLPQTHTAQSINQSINF